MGVDDWGLQDGLMLSLDMIEEFYLPHYRKNWALAHELGMDVWLHSCGNIIELLPLFIAAGVNVIQQDQQENMGIDVLDEKFGGKIAFWNPVDIQYTMVTGTPEEVAAYARKMMETLGGHNGSYISHHYPSPNAAGHPPENTRAMCEAFRKYAWIYSPPADDARTGRGKMNSEYA